MAEQGEDRLSQKALPRRSEISGGCHLKQLLSSTINFAASPQARQRCSWTRIERRASRGDRAFGWCTRKVAAARF